MSPKQYSAESLPPRVSHGRGSETQGGRDLVEVAQPVAGPEVSGPTV